MVFFLVLLLFSLHGYADTEVYRWVDKNGIVHYSSTAPKTDPGQEKVTIRDKNKFSPNAIVSQNNVAKSDGNTDDTNQKAKEKFSKEVCDEIKSRLATLASQENIYSVDKSGARKYLNNKDVANKKAELDKRLKSECK